MTSYGAQSARFAVGTAQIADGAIACELVLGDSAEYTELDLSDWAAEDYVRQWREALSLLVEGGNAAGILMTWASGPTSGRVRRGWRLHRHGNDVRIQERLYVPADHNFIVDGSGVVIDIDPMERVTEDGDAISEWRTTIDAICSFLAR